MDVGTQVPHGAVRAYVMGERGAKNEPATPEDIAEMAELVREGIAAGALGFSTSRTIAHRAIDGEPVPGTFAAEDELFGIGRVLGELGRGIFEVAGAGAAGEDIAAPKREIDWMRRLSREIRRPVTFTLLQVNAAPDLWREQLALSVAALDEGAQIYPQVAGRPFGLMIGHQTKIHPVRRSAELCGAPLADARGARAGDARPRAEAEDPRRAEPESAVDALLAATGKHVPDRRRRRTTSRATRIRSRRSRKRLGREPEDVLYDQLLENDGRELLLMPVLNYAERTATRSARCCCTRARRSASATAARTAASSATRASRRSC